MRRHHQRRRCQDVRVPGHGAADVSFTMECVELMLSHVPINFLKASAVTQQASREDVEKKGAWFTPNRLENIMLLK